MSASRTIRSDDPRDETPSSALITGGVALGVALPYWLDRAPGEALSVARGADAHGFGEIWIGEMATFDAFALAGALARETASAKLVVGPLPVTLRDPVALAMGISSIAELGGRPCDLFVGASSPTVLADWHGVDTPATLTAFGDTFHALRSILSGARTDFDLPTARSSGFRLRLAESSPVQVGMAAFGPRMLSFAAEHADRVVLAHVTPEQVARVRQQLDDQAATFGRDRPILSVWMAAATTDEQTQQVMRGLVTYVGQRGYRDMFDEVGFGDLVALARSGVGPKRVLAEMPVELVETIAGIGDADSIVTRVGAFGASGADQVCIVPATAGDDTGAAVLHAVSAAVAGNA